MPKRSVLLLLLLTFCLACQGQLSLVRGTDRLSDPQENTWHWDPESHHAELFVDGEWSDLGTTVVKDIFRCNDFLVVKLGPTEADLLQDPKTATVRYHYYSSDNPRKTHFCDGIFCADSMMGIIWDQTRILFQDNRPGLEFSARDLTVSHIAAGGLQQQIVQNTPAYCAPAAAPGLLGLAVNQPYRNWGIIGTNGKWLIEPRFDAYFTFENGIAEVSYYGQKRKINEKGEFVE